MSLNNEYRFGSLPTTHLPRSVFKMKKNWKGTFNAGDIIPFFVRQIVVPGSTYQIKQSIVCRMLTPIYPTMDDLVLDIYFFSDSWRRNWDNFKKFMGENTSGAWTQTADLEVPQVQVPATASGNAIPDIGSLWNYMGLPIKVKGDTIEASALPFRMYCEIYNYFFRNQNLIAPIATPKGDSNISFNLSYPYAGGTPLKASKLPSYFSTALPEPQKSPNGAITIPLGTEANVYSRERTTGQSVDVNTLTVPNFYNPSSGTKLGSSLNNQYPLYNNFHGNMAASSNGGTTTTNEVALSLYADLSQATAATLNALRLKAQTQMIYERDGIFGTRYFDEILYGHYGVTSGAAKWEKPAYIGGKRIPLQMNQVAQTAAGATPLGSTGAFSLTADVDFMVNQSFTEHTIIMGVMVVRQLTHTTQQGIPRQWSIKKRLDMWWHEYDHLGNQPIYNKEIYADGSPTDNEVFGYQERYAEYRYEENTIAGEFTSTGSTPLDSWHYGDLYNSLPVLSQNWIEETKANIDRTIAVQNHDQFMVDTTLYIKAIQPLPVYATPGLIDHF